MRSFFRPKKIETYFLLAWFFCCFLSCQQKKTREDYVHAYENKLGIKPSQLAQVDSVNFTTIQWLEPVKNFGTVHEGDSVIITFRCRNTGEHPLFLSNFHSPCGCTIPRYTDKVIIPGEEEDVPVYFNTWGQDSIVQKSIVVTSNTSNGAKHTLFFEGKIIPRPSPVKDKKNK
ncbi:MAG TPA: DUF1573 domain-containing protein [Chitinophagaceae bacterium]|nr:DUF1573 domain-containing protein [Chitinophagaceae bacterium]